MSFYKQVTSKPWEYQGPVTGSGPESAFNKESERIALTLFLVVVCVIFSLLTVTYYLRMDLGDWVPLADPAMLWVNTVLLLLGSVALQRSTGLARRGLMSQSRSAFLAGGVLASLFVGGQCYVWLQLNSSDLGVASNPSSAFLSAYRNACGASSWRAVGLEQDELQDVQQPGFCAGPAQYRVVHDLLALSAPAVGAALWCPAQHMKVFDQ